MTDTSHRHPGEALPAIEHGDESRRPTAGKSVRTEKLPPVQRRTPGGAQPNPGAAAARDVDGDPHERGEDPFATHLIGSESSGTSKFLEALDADDIVISPRPLRLEPGRPGAMTALPLSPNVLPPDSAPVPLWCKLIGRDGRSVDEAGGHWGPALASGPSLALAVPGPGSYRLELHVNAGRPGYRILKRQIRVGSASEETVAADEGQRLHAASAATRGATDRPTPSVATYRDMLAAVLAAEQFTNAGDPTSYERAAHMLEPVSARLYEIYPTLLDRRAERGFGKNVIDRRFGAARDNLKSWLGHLYLDASIKADDHVLAFSAAETEIKLGTGEKADLSDLQAADDAAITSAKVVGVGALAIVAAPIAIEVLAAIGTEAAALQIGARLYTWAVANPQSALFLAEYLAAMGIGILDRGPEDYFNEIQSSEDLAWAVMHALMDVVEFRGGMRDGPEPMPRSGEGSGQRRSRQTAPADTSLDDVDVPTPGRGDNKRGKKGNKPALETETASLDGREFINDIRKMSPQARHVVRQLEKRGWVRVDQIHPDDLVAISKWFGREIGVMQSPYAGGLRVVLGTRDGVLQNQVKPGEVFIVHTHPVMVSKQSHFDLDLPSAGKHVEAVVDWSGQITYFSKTGIKNPIRPDGTVEPLLGYQAAFVNESGGIGGFAKIDIVDGPDGTTVKVRE